MQTSTTSQHIIAQHPLTHHAELRMQQRGIPERLVEVVLRYGRTLHARSLCFRVIGHKEMARYAREGIDLADAKGIHVLVCCSDGSVVTTYRNHDLRAIRPCKRKHTMHH
jgi:hypothetical protein